MCYCPKLHILTAKERQRILILLTDLKKKITSEHSSVPYHLTFTQTLWQKAFQPKLPHYIWPGTQINPCRFFVCVCVHKLSGPARSMPTLKKGQQQKHTHTRTHKKNPVRWQMASTDLLFQPSKSFVWCITVLHIYHQGRQITFCHAPDLSNWPACVMKNMDRAKGKQNQ